MLRKTNTYKHIALLGIEVYEISTKFIYELRQELLKPEKVFKILPRYCINENGKILLAENYHQFTGQILDDDKKFLFFNLKTIDNILEEEINEVGEEELFEFINFKECLSNFKFNDEEIIKKFTYPKIEYLFFELIYKTYYDRLEGSYQGEFDIFLNGYLDISEDGLFNYIKL